VDFLRVQALSIPVNSRGITISVCSQRQANEGRDKKIWQERSVWRCERDG